MERSKTVLPFWIFTITSLVSNIASEPWFSSSHTQDYSGNSAVVMQGPQITDPNQAFVADPLASATTGLASEVELSISCTGLTNRDFGSKSDPMCVTYVRSFREPDWREVHRTEVVKNNLNPTFLDKPVLQFAFSDKKTIMFKIYDADKKLGKKMKLQEHDYLGMARYNLADLMKRGKVTVPLIERTRTNIEQVSKTAQITIVAEKLVSSQDKVYMELAGYNIVKKDKVGHSDPFIQIFKVSDSGQEQLAFRTEVIKNTGTPHWKPFMVALRSLCNGNYGRTLIFKCWDWDEIGASDYIGEFSTTLGDILAVNPDERSYQLINSLKGNSIGGTINILNLDLEIVPTFADYVRGGLRMHCMIAIDFTKSNGVPTDPSSLHYRTQGMGLNKYELAIHAVVDIIEDYDYDKMFTAYGYGAQFPPGSAVSYAFNLNPNGADCAGVQGVLQAYRNALSNITLSQPTNFQYIIRKAIEIAAGFPSQQDNYLILLILTDGEISDMPQTQSALAEAAQLPISVIIVGIGGKSFANMQQLDNHANPAAANTTGTTGTTGTNRMMTNTTAVTTVTSHRDIVKFVALSNYGAYANQDTQLRLAKDVLEEVPNQVVAFMKSRGYPPRTAVFVNDMSAQQGYGAGYGAAMPGAYPQGGMPMQPPYGGGNYDPNASYAPNGAYGVNTSASYPTHQQGYGGTPQAWNQGAAYASQTAGPYGQQAYGQQAYGQPPPGQPQYTQPGQPQYAQTQQGQAYQGQQNYPPGSYGQPAPFGTPGAPGAPYGTSPGGNVPYSTSQTQQQQQPYYNNNYAGAGAYPPANGNVVPQNATGYYGAPPAQSSYLPATQGYNPHGTTQPSYQYSTTPTYQ